MVRRALGLATAMVVAAPTIGFAASADDVRAALGRYLGRDALSVTAEGDSFRVALDVHTLFKALEPLGASVDPAVYAVTLTPSSDGLWQVASSGLSAFTVRFGSQTYSVVTNGQSFSGRFDPSIPTIRGRPGCLGRTGR